MTTTPEQAVLSAARAVKTAEHVYEQAREDCANALFARLFGPPSALDWNVAQEASRLAGSALDEARSALTQTIRALGAESEVQP